MPLWLWLLIVIVLVGGGIAVASSSGSDDDAVPTLTDNTVESDDTATDSPDQTDRPPETNFVTIPAETAETTPAITTPPLTLPTVPSTEAPTTTAAGPQQGDLVITEQWFYPDGDNTYGYGGIVENKGTQSATGFIEIEIDFFDATDRILSTESAFVDTVIPGVRTPFTSSLIEPAAPPVRMEVRLADDNFIDEAAGAVGNITIANVATADDGFEFDVTGDATSTFTVDLDLVQLVALWRDANGVVIYTAIQYLDRVPAGSTTAFTISSFDDVAPRVAPTEILFIS
ncbi:MAG: hypothetical protein JWN99_82 [Ilumatobacteraceae bacterium]|nr:hypothetical protein [Ilumatobacteraceae bacterium]